jgi:hypothetical protein
MHASILCLALLLAAVVAEDTESSPGPCDECISMHCSAVDDKCTCFEETCLDECIEQHTEEGFKDYMDGGEDSTCCKDNGGCDESSSEGDAGPSEDCIEGCIEDCYGSDKFQSGTKWNEEQCVCLVTDCYDSKDCTKDDVKKIEDFVDGGCGANDSSYDYSYDWRNVEDIAKKQEDGAQAIALSVVVAVTVAML